MTLKKISRLDGAGIFVSLLCALHCAALPILLSLLPFTGLAFLKSEWVEFSIILTSLMIAILSLRKSYREHHKLLPFYIMLSGFCVLAAGHIISEQYEWVLLVVGGLLIAAAHLINWRYHHVCTHYSVDQTCNTISPKRLAERKK